MADQAFLKYYTTDSVLNRYGGTLQSLYSNHTPIRPAGSYRFYKLVASKVTYAVGNNEAVMSAIPTSLRSYVTPGYMQFRAFDLRGYPIALCLGVKMTRGDASRVCIGGGSNNNIRSCGDFVGWDGGYRSRATTYSPSSTGRPLYYIDSSILIFTR
uniref:Uncharacterized protein n=1 Tax=Ciona savignyi TaxID=51511 RepID=H2YWL6_CIOSA